MWNDLHVYRLDQAFQPRLVFSALIDVERPNVGGTTAIFLNGSILTAYGVNRTLTLDLATCAQVCEPKLGPAADPPPVAPTLLPCSVAQGEVLLAESVATTRGNKVLYHDVFLTRRRTSPVGVRLVDNPFGPTSLLYIGTRIETVD
jgi:hypothetical protein